jgi:hypothetical protein
MSKEIEISVKGKRQNVNAWPVGDVMVVQRGQFIKIAEIFDEYWIEREKLPSPDVVIAELLNQENRLDLFTFTQKIPNIEPRYNHHLEWDNVAAIPISTHEHWFRKQISQATRRNIKASAKRGVVVAVSEYNEDYIKGIMSIYNESPIRHRKTFWHYGKDFQTVKDENGTYSWRSTFLAAYFQNEMIGYLKIVWDKDVGAIMQILSKLEHLQLRPNNALLSEAVRQCENRNANFLLYEKFNYGNKFDSLTAYKQSNGFVRKDIPRYYIPLSKKGSLMIRLGLHKSFKEVLPERVIKPLRTLRDLWYDFKTTRRN